MKNILLLILALLVLSSHDMFLKLSDFQLAPRSASSIDLYNGTFAKSDNVITRDRMIDVSLVGLGVRTKVDTVHWSEDNGITRLNFTTGEAGTWVAGVSTRARNIELEAESFNDYLKHDGVVDMLKWRADNDAMSDDAIEKYSKHVKTVFQVGEQKTEDWKTVLGYPIEFVPLSNPYDAKIGDKISFQLLREGKPLANQVVYAGSDHDHGHRHEHEHDHEGEEHEHNDTQYRTDNEGHVTVLLSDPGKWFIRTIHMELLEEPGLTHESNWATLTFGVTGESSGAHDHAHGEGTHTHGDGTHTHSDGSVHEDHDHSIAPWMYGLGALLFAGGLYFGLRRKAS